MSRRGVWVVTVAIACAACGDDDGSGGSGGDAADGGAGAGSSNDGGAGAGSTDGGGGSTGDGGAPVSDLQDLLERLRADRDGTMLEESVAHGWPVRVAEGLVVVSTDPELASVAGDFNAWQSVALTVDEDFAWGLLPDEPQRYKLTDGGSVFVADPFSRSYEYDDNGEMSMVAGAAAHLERFFEVGAGQTALEPRVVRVLVPEAEATHVLYMHDGQNLFSPEAFFGGWRLTESAPAGLMIVGIDNTSARFDEYTHVEDDIGGTAGGRGAEYAALIEEVIRPLVDDVYSEPAVVGTMGSSLGGLISLVIGLEYPDRYDFVGSMSGTVGWGSIGIDPPNETIIEHYEGAGVMPFVVYLDSGGDGDAEGACPDTDQDGILDDEGSDNYCENIQLRDVLEAEGYVYDDNLFHWHEPGAPHNEAAWAARVFRPFDIFMAL